MITSTPRKTGRPLGFHKDRHGNRIEGLFRLKDGRWRASGPEKFTFTERDEDLAISRFREWEDRKKNKGSSLGTVRVHDDFNSAFREVMKRAHASGGSIKAEVTSPVVNSGKYAVSDCTLNEQQWAWLRQQIIDRPLWVAQRVGIEQIGYLKDIPKPTPSPTLETVGQLYLDKPKISPNWRAKAKGFWKEFRECVEVTNLRDLTQEHLVDYYDEVIEAAQSPSYIRQRFGCIRIMLNYPPKRAKWAEDCKRALAFCGVLVPPKKSATDPQPIKPEHFRKLMEKADAEMKAILLLALNCCMYASEVATLKWSDIDLEKGVLSSARTKTGIVRIAVLWPETIAALKEHPRTSDAVFLTEAGTQADYLCAYRKFKEVRKAAGLEKTQFSQIRDGAYTNACEAGVELNVCKMLAGHANGISDHYIKRRPQMVAAACEAVRKAYAPLGA